ncbi:MAG TPA: hypothetical protein VMO26_17960 [Vicinamibacterales bacterium]|nr:hypothetical protein [Vicinamibacterales bacterium]
MDLNLLTAISDIVATVAVVISLLYLANQIRAQNREARIAAVHEISEAFRNATAHTQDAALASVYVRGKNDFEALEETERMQFVSLFHSLFRVWEDAFYQHRGGRLDERVWNAMVAQYSGYLSLPGFVRVWQIRKHAYSDDFRAFVDGTQPREYVTL